MSENLELSPHERPTIRIPAHSCSVVDRIQQEHSSCRERKPPPMPQFEPKMIRDSNPDFRINPDPDVCRICPKMFWCIILSASVISPSMINTNKCPKISYSAMVKKRKWPGIHTRIRITTKIWSFLEGNFLPVPANCHVWSTSVSAFVSYPVYRVTKRQTERSQCHNLRLVGGGYDVHTGTFTINQMGSVTNALPCETASLDWTKL